MKFVDEINIYVASGKSGDGLASFSNKKLANGGNGGRGGHVYLLCDSSVSTFYHLKFMYIYKAENGANGKKNGKTGKSGKDLFIKVPPGTIVYDSERNILIGELLKHNDSLLVVSSGKPGYGNLYFKKYNKKFDMFKIGSKSVLKFLHLELNLLADVGLLGFPNVGKSSFICCVSNVISKIGEYKFTTVIPILGHLKFFLKNIILADIPGIITNSSNGSGLGFDFLKHLLKTKLLLNFFDLNISYHRYIFYKNLFVINDELTKFNLYFLNKRKWIVLNKSDLLIELYSFSFFYQFIKKCNLYPVFVISSKKKIGLKKLIFNINEYF